MLLANLDKPESYAYLPEALIACVEHLKSLDLENLELGRHEVDGDQVFINVMEFETGNPADKQAEVHKEYLDVQVLIKGEERIDFGLYSELNPVSKEYDDADDYYLVSKMNAQCTIDLEPRMFAIFFPEEPHKPGCFIFKPTLLKKAVMKVHKSLV